MKIKLNQKTISIAISLAVAIMVAGIIGLYSISAGNKGIRFEEKIKTEYSNIDKELQRKYSVFTNMVESIESYNQYEGETLEKVIAARKSGDLQTGEKLISALSEQYPDLKSSENYRTYMTEISITSNRIANYTENYNNSVKEYNSWARSFPARLFYSHQDFKLYENVNSSKGIDGGLFKRSN